MPPYSPYTKNKFQDTVYVVFKYFEDDCTLARDSENYKTSSLDRNTLRRFTFFQPSRDGSSISRNCSSKTRCMRDVHF